ncbi:HPF/RaiA family ribosome-associated protein [Kitasatospora sp. NA04385]|uniref:ribosome hibernation promotion factor n=1 Tax=Kitasatospora sp. NA04385 TaxID=2742135 RepID=UPI0015916CD0|nr:HPF/RaiA family ribosome-associated protein [Kitasatospora sp. NA04385]QKW18084.1 HPF/RaiA family ribosome-associated protein [Kitasatospora sp. NA04385]
MSSLQTRPRAEVLVETRGAVTAGAPQYAREKVAAVLERLEGPVLAVRVRLVQEANRSVARPSLAQVVVDLNGRPVRAHVAAETMREAVDLLQDRLASRLARLRHHRQHAREPLGRPVGGGGEHRPERRVRPPEERQVVRHKSYGLARCTPLAAVRELEAMDYDFHLFTDAGSGRESVVYRGTAGGYRLASAGAPPAPVPGLVASRLGVPVLTPAQARGRLDLSGLPFVFFTDAATGRGHVLYHRYDGHYGLITPAAG